MADLKHLEDFQAVRILVPIRGSHPLPLDCVAKSENPPFIDVYFIEGQLPADKLDPDGECQISFEKGGRTHAMRASIDKVVSGERLRLAAVQVFTREQTREYFRVDVELALKYRRHLDDGMADARQVRGRINLSGGGVWMPVREEFDPRDKISLEIVLPSSPPERIFGVAEVVRMTGDAKARGVALKFVEMESADRDAIVGFCFQEQRRQLRTRVRIDEI